MEKGLLEDNGGECRNLDLKQHGAEGWENWEEYFQPPSVKFFCNLYESIVAIEFQIMLPSTSKG